VRLQLIAPARTFFAAVLFFARTVRAASPDDGAAPSTPEAPDAPVAPFSEYSVRVAGEFAAYQDTDHVFVESPTIAATIAKPASGWNIKGSYLIDVVSAASVDIVSTASRRWEEVRHAGTLGGTYQPGNFGVSPSASVSVEPDYLSLAGSLVLTQDLMNKNVTLLAGYEHGHDVSGRSDTPFSVFSHTIDHDAVKAGITLVLDRATILTNILDFDFEHGDTSKPYRYIPLFAPGTSVAAGASIDAVNSLRLSERVLEQLPLSRNRYSATSRLAHRFRTSTLRIEERLYVDTWSLKATTTDARFLFDLARRVELGPHVRGHAQTSVNFWQRAYTLRSGFDFPALRTGDRELGPLYNLTGGGTIRIGVGPTNEPDKWVLGISLNATYTRYLDDLYVTDRVSTLGILSLEGEL
jgi:hypothetical protein